MLPSTAAYFVERGVMPVCVTCGHFSGMHEDPNVKGCWAPMLVPGPAGSGVYGSALYEQPCRCPASREAISQQASVLDACYE